MPRRAASRLGEVGAKMLILRGKESDIPKKNHPISRETRRHSRCHPSPPTPWGWGKYAAGPLWHPSPARSWRSGPPSVALVVGSCQIRRAAALHRGGCGCSSVRSVRDVVPVIGCGCVGAHQVEGVAGGHPEGCELLTP